MKRIVLIISLVAGAGFFDVASGQTAVDPAKAQNIRRLLEITGSHNLGQQMIEQMMAMLRTSLPAEYPVAVRDKIFNIYEEEMRKGFTVEKVNAAIIPIYDKYLTADELIALIAFYETPLGKKVVGTLPQIFSEASAAGELLGREVQERALARIKTEVAPAFDTAPDPRQPTRRRPARRPRTR
jgi:hypothetical protein